MLNLYIELGEYREFVSIVLVFSVATIIFFSLLKYSRQNNSNDRNKDFKIPVWLLRAHITKFVSQTSVKYKDIEEKYILFLKKYFSILELDFKYEAKQLKFLIENNINVEKTIKEGFKELHKKKLLILVFLFNISVRSGNIFEKELSYLNRVYKDLGITYQVYESIKAKYIKKEKKPEVPKQRQKILIACRILGCNESSTIKEIKDAYRFLAKKYHPDKNMSLNETKKIENSEKFRKISEAYQFLIKKNSPD